MNKVTFLVLFAMMMSTVCSMSPQMESDDSEEILCNVIVRATHDLQVNEKKSIDEIRNYLKSDCQKLDNEELIEQCDEIINDHLDQISEHLTNGTELSQICKQINDLTEEQCSSNGGDKCQCCIQHVKKRKMRFRYMIKQMAKKRLRLCEKSPRPERCRHWIRRKERHALMKINRICPFLVCKHLGYCPKKSELILNPSIDQQLESYFSSNVCEEFRSSQSMCLHLLASTDARRFANLYLAILHNDKTWIDQDLRGITKEDSITCMTCKNTIQSSMEFYQKNLEIVGQALDRMKCKETIGRFLDEERTTIEEYLKILKPEEVCSEVQLCVEQCQSCIQRFQSRKDAAIAAIDRLLTTQTNIFPNQQFLSEILNDVRSSINQFDLGEMCAAMGLCGENAEQHINDYESFFIEEMGKGICSMLNPLNRLCEQIIQGHSMEIQTINLNQSFMKCDNDIANTTETNDPCENGKDQCKCCIRRVMEKKRCWKKQVAKYISHMIRSCQRCPARERCERYWQEKKACWDTKIDKICPMKACIHMGYCKKGLSTTPIVPIIIE